MVHLLKKKLQLFLEEEYNKGIREMSTEDICKMIGKHLGEDSFLYSAFKNDVKVIVPRNYGWCCRKPDLDVFTETPRF